MRLSSFSNLKAFFKHQSKSLIAYWEIIKNKPKFKMSLSMIGKCSSTNVLLTLISKIFTKGLNLYLSTKKAAIIIRSF
jgi:hypothetical protein